MQTDPFEIVTVAEMNAADRYAAENGVSSLTLMENAGKAVADEIAKRFQKCPLVVLCGPGNNGGDGYVAARYLKHLGWDVTVAAVEVRKDDAKVMAARWDGKTVPLAPEVLNGAALVLDALYGAGLSRPIDGPVRDTVWALKGSDLPVISIDIPSGLHGDRGRALDDLYVDADLTVTFFRLKPAHVLMPGRLVCGEVVLADIGIPQTALDAIKPATFVNGCRLWGKAFPKLDPLGHKYSRGHAVVVSGPPSATGAARLAARGALRIGAGLVSVASPPDAVLVNATQLTAIMVKPFEGADGLARMLTDKRYNAIAIGPGCGVGEDTRYLVDAVLETRCVLDADALTSFHGDPKALFYRLNPDTVMTPHEGEFERIFPGLMAEAPDRIAAVRAAAGPFPHGAGCVVLLKGPDTVIAGPDGRVAISTNAPPTLATAGSGDVLSGFILGLMAQGMEPFLAACAGVWLHGEAAKAFGPGLIAEDLPEQLPALLRKLYDEL